MVLRRNRECGRVEDFSGIFEVNAVVQVFSERWKCVRWIFWENIWEFFDRVEQSIKFLGKLSSGARGLFRLPERVEEDFEAWYPDSSVLYVNDDFVVRQEWHSKNNIP